MSDRHYSTNSPFAGVFIEVGQGRIITDLLFSGVNYLVDSYSVYRKRREDARLRRETLQVVSQLSPQLQRDIGWPERFEEQMRRQGR